jgi:DNA-binding SARP family transcriptional activator
MLRLRTFGGLSLQQDGDVITGVPTQRRQLALLALLAVAGEEGMSREKILAYLWPEAGTERARHALNQLLYLQRRYANDPDLFAGRKTLRLPPEMMENDVRAFETAIAEGRPADAVEIYQGPFLDGFFLDEAAAFEEWVSELRERFSLRYLRLLDELATGATELGEFDVALEWRRRAAKVDPLDPRLVGCHVDALLKCGNRAGALRVLQAHRERLRSELGLEPEPDIQQLEQRIRAGWGPAAA